MKIVKQWTALITFTVISRQLCLNFHTTSVLTDYHKWLRHFQIKAVTKSRGMDIYKTTVGETTRWRNDRFPPFHIYPWLLGS